MSLSAFGVFVYTTLGGVIGSGLTQYVTHLRDRRTARADILERVSAAEEEYDVFVRKSAESFADGESPSSSDFNKALASLQRACLIASVPRENVTTYAVARKASIRVSSFRSAIAIMGREINRRKRAIEAGFIEEEAAKINEGLSLVKKLQTVIDEFEDSCGSLGLIAYDELMRSVWNPFIVRFRKGQLHKTQRQVRAIEDNLRVAERESKRLHITNLKLENKQYQELLANEDADQIPPSIQ